MGCVSLKLYYTRTIITTVILFFLLGVDAADKKAQKKTAAVKTRRDDLVASETSQFVIPPQEYVIDVNNDITSNVRIQNPASFFQLGKSPAVQRCGNLPINCPKSARYRTFDGTCTNPLQPACGRANNTYARMGPVTYADGFQIPTMALSGKELPNAREVSFTIFPDTDIDDAKFTLVNMQWGQIVTHDMGAIAGGSDQPGAVRPCCTQDGRIDLRRWKDPACFPIVIPKNDPVYVQASIECLNFVRSDTDLTNGCLTNRNVEQVNTVTQPLDLSIIYGSSNDVASSLRARVGGRLIVDIRGNREFLPPNPNATDTCRADAPDGICYLAGDLRVNQNPQLTILHTILWREHNRIAGVLHKLNPHWTDETIYQETRRIVIAEYQHISYSEWLPIQIGQKNTRRNKLMRSSNDYVNDFDSSVCINVFNEHAHAAFRYFHSLIAGSLKLAGEGRCPFSCKFEQNNVRMTSFMDRPGIIERYFDDLTRGMGTQPEKASDIAFDQEMRHFLFRRAHELGTDLRAIDIQRGRDHGLASYNDMREKCQMPRARDWNDFQDLISPENIDRLRSLYENVDDVELTVAGSLERHLPGSLAGPTFLCILVEQFYNLRVGDRFWYETGDQDVAFTIEQLNEIRKSSLSRLLCDNGDNIQTMQPRGFVQISEKNPLAHCSQLPSIELGFWKDYAPGSPHLDTSSFFKKK